MLICFGKRQQSRKYLVRRFSHEFDCYKIKTGNCVLDIFSKDQIVSLPSYKSPSGRTYLLTDTEELKAYKNRKKDESIQALIDYVNNSNCKYRCLETAFSILVNGYDDGVTNDKIDLELYSDGHYEIEDGRHRFCIAARLKIPMVAHFKAIGSFDGKGFIE